jgi:hypothetical protein
MGGVLFTPLTWISCLPDFSDDCRPAARLGKTLGPVLMAEPGFGALLNQVPDGNIRADHLPGHA